MSKPNQLLVEALESEAKHVKKCIQYEYATWLNYHDYNIKSHEEMLEPLERRAASLKNKLDKKTAKLSSKQKSSRLLISSIRVLQKSLNRVQPEINDKRQKISESKSFIPERDLNTTKYNSMRLKLARLEEAIMLAKKGRLDSEHARNIQDLMDANRYQLI